jgi:hypothetical protein
LAVLDKIKSAINAFRDYEKKYPTIANDLGPSSYNGRNALRFGLTNERSIITSIYTRISVDVAGINMRHVEVDEDDRYVDDVESKLNLCLNFEANLDQGPRHFRQDIVTTLIDRGVAAIVPVDTSVDENGNVEIYTLRVGEIVQWYAQHVRVSVYNEATGNREEITLEKTKIGIVENPLHAVMNGSNSTLQRLVNKLSVLDEMDESASRLDMIIQLPYTIKSEAKREQAETRRKDIEFQLKESQYGIAYADATEKITQLNRPAENQLMAQVDRLTSLLYAQLGLTDTVMDGTADEAAMLNYINRTIEPMLDAIKEAMTRSLLGPVRYARGERIFYFRDPFKLVPLTTFAEIADKLSRNEIVSPNEIRGYMGIVPSKDPKADALNNSNMPGEPVAATTVAVEPEEDLDNVEEDEEDDFVMGAFDEIEKAIDDTFADFDLLEEE